MTSIRLRKLLLIALAALTTVCIAVIAGLNFIFASADSARAVTISGSTIFVTSGGAEVWSHKDGDDYYTMFVLNDGDSAVEYRRNLAYEWFYNANTDGDAAAEVAQGYLNMEIGFEGTDFGKFIITFESQQYAQTKDGKTSNYIMFAPNGDGKVRVYVTDDIDESVPETDVTVVDGDHIVIGFAASETSGAYDITVNGEVVGAFTNIGGVYSKYVSSTTSPVIPISFGAEFNGEEQSGGALMVLYSLNGQSFMLTEQPDSSNGHYLSGKVYDTASAVLCLDSGFPFIELGDEITFDYTVIDVLANSPSTTTSYFMLTKEQAALTDFDSNDYSDENLFRKVTDSDNQYMIPHAEHYLPQAGDYDASVFDGVNLTAEAAVKVAVKVTDTTATGGISDYVMLDWYVGDEYVVTVNGNKYIAVANDEVGPTYAYTDVAAENSNPDSDEWQSVLNAYQEAVNEAAKDLKAGSKNYFYLPSADSLFTDNTTRYTDLSFNIYYNNGTQNSSTGKSSSGLSINLTKAGKYVFTIYVTDASGNGMYYFNPDYNAATDDGDDKTIDISTSNIWSMYEEDEDGDFADTRKYLPWFEFTVAASDLDVEDPDEQDIAYVGSTYSAISFDINGVEYSAKYSLYLFDNESYAKTENNGVALTYDEFISMKTELMDWVANPKYRNYFTEIRSINDMSSTDEEYQIYGDYAWNNSSLSFVPQQSGFYVVKCAVTSKVDSRPEVTAHMVISVSEHVDSIVGEDTWVQDNLVSIILLVIAGASLICIILLLVIKPKDKGDIDEVALKDSSAKAKKSKKSKKSK